MEPRQSTFEQLVKLLGTAGTAITTVRDAVTALSTSLAAVASAAVSRRVNTTAPLAGGGALSADLTLSVANATNASVGVVALIGDVTGTATNLVVSRINGGTAPAAPVTADIGKPIMATAAGVYSLGESQDIGWTPWCGQVTITGADTSVVIYSRDLTDIAKANSDYLIVVEFDVLLNTTDTAHVGYWYQKQVYSASFNGSGVPTFGTTAWGTGYNDFAIDHSGTPGIPTITSVTPSASGASINLTLAKPASADNTFAQTRSRITVMKESL